MARVSDLEPFSKKHGIKLITVADLIRHRLGTERLVTRVSEAQLPTDYGTFRIAAYESANSLRADLEYLGPVEISTVSVGGRQLYRVRIGPIKSVARADSTLASVIDQGHTEARIVID